MVFREVDFVEIFKLSKLNEEEARRFIKDAENHFSNNNNITDNDIWDWLIDRLSIELQNNTVKNQGYLEGLSWKEFFKDFKNRINLSEIKNKSFYKHLFSIYKRILWSFEDIKDENMVDLKTFDAQHDKAYQYMPVFGTHGIQKISVKNALKNFNQG